MLPAAALPADLSASHDLLHTLLEVSLTAVNVLRPLYDPAGELVDFALVYVNPAGQRINGLPEHPDGTLLGRFPHTKAAGIFDYYRRVYAEGATGGHEVNYQADGLDNYFRLAAQRSGDLLVVSFTDTSDQDRSAVEEALRQSQTAEQAARAQAERQRGELERVFEQAPVAIAVYRGPNYTIELANPTVARLWGRTREQLLGKGLFEALPEVAGMGYEQLLDQVMATGVPHMAQAMEAQHERNGELETVYWDFVYVPMHAADGHINGAMVVANEVTTQVRARQQVQQLNQELEKRVLLRTQELAEQQRLLHQILAHVPAAIATLRGPEHRFTFANDRYQQLTAGRVQVGRTVADTLPEVAEQGFIELLDNVYRSGQAFEGKEIAIMLALPGQPPVQHYLDFTYQPLPDEHGQTQGILVFVVDVSEQVRTRQQAAALQAQLLATAQHQAAERLAFYQIFEQTPALVALLRSPGHRFEYANPAYQALFPGRQLVGQDAVEVAPELAAQGFVALLDRVYQTGETYFGQQTPFTLRATPGEPPRTSYFDFTYQAYREDGEVAGISIFAFDVTEQVLIRQQRELERERIKRLFMDAPAAICILDGPDLVYELVNPDYQALFPGRELLGKPILAALPEIENNLVYTTFRQVYDTGRTHEEQALHIPLVRPTDGVLEDRYFKYIQQPRYARDGHIDGVLVFAFEVTEQVRTSQQVQTLNEELQESNRQLTRTNVDLDTFVYTASHDLKAPISNIESIVIALRETLPPAVQQAELVAHLLGLLDQTVARFQFTIGQLTDITKLQLAHAGPAEPVPLAHVVEGVRLDLAPTIQAADTQLTVEVDPELVVSFSPANLRSVVYNLLSNAVKYCAPDRPSLVQVRAERTPHGVVLTVQDNGLGMSAVQQRQLFGLFQRLHTHVEGTGVGLYISKRLVENAGGTIAVQSLPDQGTTFTITFPA